MIFANEENISQTFLQICRGTVLSGNVLIPGRITRQTVRYFGGHEFTDIRMHIRYDLDTCLLPFLN